ncbi:hypothetical protein CBR_g66749 [Chara braunii]|uniref:Uncharacterized protein n=1 Tax=Chara braunii TaxID=69332 RepID=A0A388JQ98_CHABU|nr:hypothetical protein CBR_g66749 [Chara braunii]|eukprot:GBG59943.1 hypothetical protein CBR_g66749 [Chara braunii]
MVEESGLAKILLWRRSYLTKVLLHESVHDSMAPDLQALLFRGRNLSDFLRNYQNLSRMKMWDEKAMCNMLPLFVGEELSEEIYTLMLKSRTWGEFESSLRLRFPEDGEESQHRGNPVQVIEIAQIQGDLSSIQRQMGVLEGRMIRLEEARKGKRKISKGTPSEPTGGKGKEKVDGDQGPSPLMKVQRMSSGVQERERGKEIGKEERERKPPQLTKAQRKARNLAKGGQGTGKEQCSRHGTTAPQGQGSSFAPIEPSPIGSALHRWGLSCNPMISWPMCMPCALGGQDPISRYGPHVNPLMSFDTAMTSYKPSPTFGVAPPTSTASVSGQCSKRGGRGQGIGTGRGNGRRGSNGGREGGRRGSEGRDERQRNHRWKQL